MCDVTKLCAFFFVECVPEEGQKSSKDVGKLQNFFLYYCTLIITQLWAWGSVVVKALRY